MSRCASKCTSATGPCTRFTDRSIGSAIVWSPPMAMTLRSPWSRSAACAAICPMASSIENGVTGTSPASTTWMAVNGLQSSSTWWPGRRCREACRTAIGPNRAPGR